MTTGECCVQPFFSPDGSRILYLDRPAPDAVAGIWAVTVTQPLAEPALFSERLGPFSSDLSHAIFLQNGNTVVERLADGAQWIINNGGRRVSFSPDAARIVWSVGEEVGNFDVRRSEIWVADVTGENSNRVTTLYGGGVQAWFKDGARLLVSGKVNRADITSTLGILDLTNGVIRKLADVDRTRSMLLSPDNQRVIYYVSQSRDAARNGTYLLDFSVDGAQPQRLDIFGAYRWCSSTQLYYIPLNPGAPSTELWRYDTTTLTATPILTVAADSPFTIANGDWDLAPDGRSILYLNARDRNIWMVTLPESCGE